MSAIKPNATAFAQLAAEADAKSGPVVMLNLLKFKEQADGDEVSGRESYNRYGRDVKPMVEKLGGRILWHGKADQLLIGDEEWDSIALVEYPSRKAFIEMATSQQMNDIHHNREAGLERTVLIACTELGGDEV
ncbi:MAG TPA: DUF1330 domain-containing protein [Dehalococcoidia bacterium]|nr:DUF1330 domain-containing protein [Dehalococcoidia bacterium]